MAYSFVRTISIDHTKVPSDQTDFPALIAGTFDYLKSESNGGSVASESGFDIALYADSDLVTLLDFELASYDPATGAVEVWVRVPSLSSTTDTVVYLAYGNDAITTDQSNKTGTWQSDFVAVLHLGENPNGGAPQLKDSTSYTNHMSMFGIGPGSNSMSNGAGVWDSGSSLVLNNSEYNGHGAATVGQSGMGNRHSTLSIWYKRFISHGSYDGDRPLFGTDPVTYPNHTNQLSRYRDDGVRLLVGTESESTPGSPGLTFNSWAYLSGTYDGTTAKLYVNGSLSTSASINRDTIDDLLVLGQQNEGQYDEARVSKIARSADWIATEYANMSNPASFISIGDEMQVTPTTVTLSWSTPEAITYPAALSLTELSATVDDDIPGTLTYDPPLATVLDAGGYTLTVAFEPDDPGRFTSASAEVTITVNKGTPSLSWSTPDDLTVGIALSSTQLNATVAGGLAGAFSYSPVAGTSFDEVGSQTLSATFTPTDSANWNIATATVPINIVAKTLPTIDWSDPAAIAYGTALSGIQLSAVEHNGVAGTFAYSPAAGTVMNVGSVTLSVTFTPADQALYTTATATVTLTVNKALPVLTWSNPSAITYEIALSATQLNATASVEGAFVYTPAVGSVLHGGSQTLSVVFTPTDTASYETITTSVTLTVNKAESVITWATPGSVETGTELAEDQLNAIANVPGTFVYDPAAGTLMLAPGLTTLSVTFTPTATADYTTVTASVVLAVTGASVSRPQITWVEPNPIRYGVALGNDQLRAIVIEPGTLVYTPSAGTILDVGEHTLTVNWTPDDASKFLPVSESVALIVNKVTPIVKWAQPRSVIEGTVLDSTQLNATANIDGTFTYTPAAGTVLTAGVHILSCTFTPSDGTNFADVTSQVKLMARAKTNPTVTWSPASTLEDGQPLNSKHLNAVASIPGTFVYDPPGGTRLGIGAHTLSVTFGPFDGLNYNKVTTTASITVVGFSGYSTWNEWSIIPMPLYPSFNTISFSMNDTVGETMSPFTRQSQIQDWPGADYWEIDLALPQMPEDVADYWISFLAALRGKKNVFRFGDPRRAFSKGTASGTPIVNGLHIASATTLNTTGWTANAQGVLLPGDYIGLGERMHKVVRPVNAAADGTAAIEIWPSSREAVANAVPVKTNNCTGLFRLADNKRTYSITESLMTGMSFKAVEAK